MTEAAGLTQWTARWVFPVGAPPIPDGAVIAQGARILAVGRRPDLAHLGGKFHDLGEAAILPGLVNCHTHLELTALPSIAATAFVPWVLELLRLRRPLPPEEVARSVEAGAAELLRSGTTCVGDVSTGGESLPILRRLGLRGVVFRELLGLLPVDAEARLRAAQEDLNRMQAEAAGSRLRPGVAPHSGYALSEDLLAAAARWIREQALPACLHAAESPAEVEFLARGGGPIRQQLYPAVNCAAPPARRPAQSPVAYLDALEAIPPGALIVHAVHVDAADCDILQRRHARIAHCPRSNARLAEGRAPVSAFRRRGIPVGLGTDSRASAPSLDLWDEMRAALAADPGGPQAVLHMATQGGADALGLGQEVGSLAPGKRADLIAVEARHIHAGDSIGSLVAATRGEDVLLTIVDGEPRTMRQEACARC
ncbi:MAG TPA: amidohydrolase family protein [Candidatus Sulfotelmatobacter sp.]|nr:amidohydrolase family protein [Candidatus Sulfotelmatobacter sp.]